MLTVGQLAERSGVPATTLRYYDAIGLLVADRLPNGHRRYPETALERLEIIRVSQALGLTLDEVAAVLGPGGGENRRSVARRKLDELDRTMQRLAAVRAVLAHFAECRHTPAESEACTQVVRRAWSGALASQQQGVATTSKG